MLFLSGFELYSRWMPLNDLREVKTTVALPFRSDHVLQRFRVIRAKKSAESVFSHIASFCFTYFKNLLLSNFFVSVLVAVVTWLFELASSVTTQNNSA